MHKIFYFIIVIVFLLFGCEKPNEPGNINHSFSLIYVARAGVDYQKLYLFRTLDYYESIGNSYPFGNFDKFLVTDANIAIHSSDSYYDDFKLDTLFLGDWVTEGTSYTYYTNAQDVNLQPNTEYKIEIQKGLISLKGKAITPGDFQILNHDKREVFKVGEKIYVKFNLEWTTSENAKYYLIEVKQAISDTLFFGEYSSYHYSDFNGVGAEYGPFYDEREYNLILGTYFDSVRVDVCAYDENSYKHFYGSYDGAGIENGHGVFGAATVQSVVVVFDKTE